MSDIRENITQWIDEAQVSGATQAKSCEVIGICAKTLQRWKQPDNHHDGRINATHRPSNKLTELERQRVISTVNQPGYAELPPSKIVPILADKGQYIASEATFYRILKENKLVAHRSKSKPARKVHKPEAFIAIMPNQIYTWDITYLPTEVRGIFLYLYLVLDIFSRKIVGWQVHDEESSAHAADMMVDICQREGVVRDQVTLHSDNGSPMKGATMLATLQELGVMPSFSRPSVSNDNPYSESMFRTLKYCPSYPEKPFVDLAKARAWVSDFVQWYNNEHLHSGIKFVTPAQRHRGEDGEILAKRQHVYEQAKLRHPNRWSGDTRNWEQVKEVYLNPERCKSQEDKNKAA